jgi:ABC-type siderophore export system fused ATPase/permease subunit
VEQGQTLLMVTHDPRNAAMANRLLRLQDGQVVEEQSLACGVRPVADVLEDLETTS